MPGGCSRFFRRREKVLERGETKVKTAGSHRIASKIGYGNLLDGERWSRWSQVATSVHFSTHQSTVSNDFPCVVQPTSLRN